MGRRFMLAAVAAMWCARSYATPRAYITNLNSYNVSVIDTSTDSVIATVPVDRQPHAVAVNADSARVYILSSDSFLMWGLDVGRNTLGPSIRLLL